VTRSRRPLHRALMLERCALQQQAAGMHEFAESLLLEALQAYRAWGATAKVAQLLAQQPALQVRQTALHTLDGRRSTGVSSEQIDMLAILRASQALSSETDLLRLQSRVDQLLISLTGATRVTLVLRGEAAEEWAVQASPHDTSLGASAAATPIDQAQRRLPVSAFRYALRTREPLLVEDAVQDDRFAADPYLAGLDRCSLLVVPIQSQGELRAVLLLENRQSRGAFSAHRLDAVNLIAGQLAVSLDNAMLYASLERKVAERTEALAQANRRLEMLAITDALTGLANRRHFNEVLEAEWQRALRTGGSIGLAMIDVDQFKLYNDHYGHLGGDACLKRVAAVLKDGQRVAADLAARYGGEEFALVLPNTDLAGTQVVAERVRRAVAGLQEPHAKAPHGIVTVSVGIAAFVPSESTSIAHWIEVADAALYEAKRQGRNQVRGPA
jgi:diguanylate cyclase (GGDEF)-like protein